MKLVVLCAMVAIAAAIPSDFNNDVIFKGRRAAAATPCLCKSNTCTVVAPKNGVLGGCASTSYDGKAPTAGTATTCTPKCNTGYNLVGTSSCKDGVFTSATCVGKPCTDFSGVKAPANGNVGTCHTTLASGSKCQVGCTSGTHSLDSDTGHYLCTNGKGSQVGNNGKCVANCALLTSSDWGSNGAKGTCTLANGVAGGKCTSGCATGYSLKAGTGTFSCPATGTKWAVKVAPKCVADCPALVAGALAAGKFGVKGAVGKCTKEKAQPLLDGKTKACTQACAGGYALKTGTGTYTCDPATGTNWKADSGKAAVCLKTCALPTKTTGSANGGWGDANGNGNVHTGGCKSTAAFAQIGTCQTECNCPAAPASCYVRTSGGKFTCPEKPDGSSNTATRDAVLVCAKTCKQLTNAHWGDAAHGAVGTCNTGANLKVNGPGCTQSCITGYTLKANTGAFKCTTADSNPVANGATGVCHKKCKLTTGGGWTGIVPGSTATVAKDAKTCNVDANGYMKLGGTCLAKCPAGQKLTSGGTFTCDPAGGGGWTGTKATCKADPVCDLSKAPTNGNVGTAPHQCTATIKATKTCTHGCDANFHQVGTTTCGTAGTATCTYSCHSTCKSGNSCIVENDATSCTACASHYTYTAAKGQKYGTCTLKLGTITLTQTVNMDSSYAIKKATFSGVVQSGFEVAYGQLLGIWDGSSTSIAGKYKKGCSVTSSAVSRRADSVFKFKAVVSELLSGHAYGVALKPSKTTFASNLKVITDDNNSNDPTGKVKSFGKVTMTWSSASTTSITGFFSMLVAAWCWTQQ